MQYRHIRYMTFKEIKKYKSLLNRKWIFYCSETMQYFLTSASSHITLTNNQHSCFMLNMQYWILDTGYTPPVLPCVYSSEKVMKSFKSNGLNYYLLFSNVWFMTRNSLIRYFNSICGSGILSDGLDLKACSIQPVPNSLVAENYLDRIANLCTKPEMPNM